MLKFFKIYYLSILSSFTKKYLLLFYLFLITLYYQGNNLMLRFSCDIYNFLHKCRFTNIKIFLTAFCYFDISFLSITCIDILILFRIREYSFPNYFFSISLLYILFSFYWFFISSFHPVFLNCPLI